MTTYRETAAEHLSKAQSLLCPTSGPSETAYACLNLRIAIEALTYERLAVYREEVSFPTLDTWQPGRILKELSELDPEANEDRDISVQVELTAGEWTTLLAGPDHRFSAAWALKAHNALGSFLHFPTLKQLSDNDGAQRVDRARQKASEVAEKIARVLDSKTWNTKIASFVRFECECGAKLARRPENLSDFARVECPECRAMFEVRKCADREFEVSRSKQQFACPTCGTQNAFSTEWVLTKPGVRCRKCKAEFDTALTLHILPRNGMGSTASD